eukprot:CAMPEP_0172547680 /NCGR_PEP_ID=MMETSP1067-20121228/17153_1 /TAXON_ID=265564 ORGANISM="Thalassiosira punctigera, Strain Tpunct2005C2" /NCGR_SAMPLE_ID=MMETSP1067 /ASSEMBLY_ACC=CAM_ASM_000444 /LENGTH=95 /DNA_ID=CAMNT_0013334801 /DNA_START=107 /DNA_END=396 /DNA_ORIENTATION=-
MNATERTTPPSAGETERDERNTSATSSRSQAEATRARSQNGGGTGTRPLMNGQVARDSRTIRRPNPPRHDDDAANNLAHRTRYTATFNDAMALLE